MRNKKINMRTASNVGLVKFVLFDVLGDIVYFPIWWYGRGAKKSASIIWKKIRELEHFLGVIIWIKNIFRPMYGLRDWQGRIISFFFRLLNIIIRATLLLVGFILYWLLWLLWLALPVIALDQIFLNIIV